MELNLAESASVLLSQQIWCWGQDINCGNGNLLVRFGFQRIEKPLGRNVASLYRLDLSPTSRVILRGFGVFCGDDRWGGLFLRRFGFAPKLTSDVDLFQPAWSSDELPRLELPMADQVQDCKQLLLTFSNWVREYEVWIAEYVGVEYRQQTLADWSPKNDKVIPAIDLACAWRMLGIQLADAPSEFFCDLGSD